MASIERCPNCRKWSARKVEELPARYKVRYRCTRCGRYLRRLDSGVIISDAEAGRAILRKRSRWPVEMVLTPTSPSSLP
jgi:transposase-like protein